MKYKYLHYYSNFFLITICIYLIIFLFSHCITPNLNQVSITIENNLLNSELQDITISVDDFYANYYLIIYQNEPDEHWIYFTSSDYKDDISSLIDNFYSLTKNKFIIFQGDKIKNEFKFSIKPKYTLDYMTNTDNLFHVYYVVPYSVFPFKKFYYSKHFYFFVNPVI